MDFHVAKLDKVVAISCPFPLCEHISFSDYSHLQIHFFDIHNLKPKGYTQSRGLVGNLSHNTPKQINPDDESDSEEQTWVEEDEGYNGWETDEDDDGWEDVLDSNSLGEVHETEKRGRREDPTGGNEDPLTSSKRLRLDN